MYIDPSCWLGENDLSFRDQEPEETSPHLLLGAQDRWLGAEQDQFPCEPLETSSGNGQGTETRMSRATTDSQKNIIQGTLEGAMVGRGSARWTTLKTVNIPAQALTAHSGFKQKRLDEGHC